jgi:ferredoxin-like protein FixX
MHFQPLKRHAGWKSVSVPLSQPILQPFTNILESPQCTIKQDDDLCVDVVSKSLDENCPDGAVSCSDEGFRKSWCIECGTRLVAAQPDASVEKARAKLCGSSEPADVPKPAVSKTEDMKSVKKKSSGMVRIKSLFGVGLVIALLI